MVMMRDMRTHILVVLLLPFTTLHSVSTEFISKDPATFQQRLKIAKEILDEAPLIDGYTHTTFYFMINHC